MTQTINRKDFVERLMRQCDMSFSDATKAFDCICDILKDGVVNGSQMRFGKLGVLRPTWHQPKEVHMGFKKGKGGRLTRNRHVYFLGRRISYRFKIYRRFIETHELHWYEDHWPVDDEADT